MCLLGAKNNPNINEAQSSIGKFWAVNKAKKNLSEDIRNSEATPNFERSFSSQQTVLDINEHIQILKASQKLTDRVESLIFIKEVI